MVDFARRGGRDDDRGRGRDDDRGRDSGRDSGRDRGGRDDSRGGRDDRGSDRGGRDEYRGSGSASRFQYKPRSREQVEKRAQGGSDFDKIMKPHIKMWTPAKGLNRVRILPATWKDAEDMGYDIFVHYGVGPDNQAYLDLRRMLDKPDPISEEYDALRRGGRASKEELRELNSTKRVLVYIIDRDQPGEGVQAWTMAQTLYQSVNSVSVDPDTRAVLNIDDPDEGYDVTFRKDGEGVGTRYTGVNISRNSSKLGKPEWLDYAMDYPLPDQLQYFSYDEIAKEFGSGGSHREDDRGDSRSGQERDEGHDRHNDDRGRQSDRGRDDRSRPAAEAGRDDRGTEERGRGRAGGDRERQEQTLDYEAVQGMTFEELSALVESDKRLSTIIPKESKDDDELRKWVCDDLGLQPPTAREAVSTRRSAARPEESPDDKLAQMRRDRAGR